MNNHRTEVNDCQTEVDDHKNHHGNPRFKEKSNLLEIMC